MDQIIVTRKDGTTYPLAVKREVTAIKQAIQSWGLLGDDVVNITVESPYPQSYAIGDSIGVFGRTYRLNQLPRVRRTGAHKYAYDLTFEGVQYDLLRAFYDVTIETTGNTLQDVHGDALTGDLRRFATVLVSNANRVFPGKWQLGTCPTTIADKTLTFGDGDNCLAVYQNLCKTFEVEATISESGGVYTIDFAKRVGVTHPFTFEFGKGGGLYALDRQNVDSSNIVTRLKVYGSSDNITNKYRAQRLCLPGKTKAQSFVEQAEAVARYGVHEARKVFDDIKPTFNGKITAVVAGSVLQFQDSTMFDLNAKEADGKTTKYLVAGVSAKIHFNTGNLAGYEFDIQKYDHATKTFTIKKLTDDRGDVFPSASSTAFQFAMGDEYKILDVTLPERYQQEAEQKLQERATEYYRQNSQPKVKYGLSVTKSYLQKLFRGGEATGLFSPGDYINVKDGSIGVDKAVRIQSLERNLLDVYSYTLTLADVAESNITTRVISELVDLDKIATVYQLKDPTRARANWRSTREVLDMVFDPDGDYYTDKIKPNSVDTLALSVGAKSMQFALQDVVFEPNYQGQKNAVRVSAGTLMHYAIEEQPRAWRVAQTVTQLGEDGTPYYVFARCPKVGNAATMIFSKTPIKVEQEAGVYHFWVGVVNSVDATLQARSMSLTYGFSTINGRFIKTGRIESADGSTYFDLDAGEIGGRVMFTSNGQRKSLDEFGSEVSRQVSSRSRVFTTQPTPPYDAGDIWVDGKVLRCCATARASGAYVAGDWVLGVAYDNTKTTIEGGLVTSGTIQVAGSASAILAGVTGYGTTPDAVRFWAGATYDNRADAPFVVHQDGTTRMSKANVSGIIDAKGGKIGGFDINDGRIGVANSYNATTGLSLTDRNIRFRGDTVGATAFASIGVLNWLGYSNAGLFELSSSDNHILGSALYAKCVSGDGSLDYFYPQRAFEYLGNVYGIGKHCHYFTGYIGEAYSDTLVLHFDTTNKFHFTRVGTGYLGMDLPTKTMIDKHAGGKDIFFNLEIVCDKEMWNKIKVKSRPGAQMYNNDGIAIDGIDMMRGDSLKLRYYNGAYHIVCKQFTT
jgi:hypothetical protein